MTPEEDYKEQYPKKRVRKILSSLSAETFEEHLLTAFMEGVGYRARLKGVCFGGGRK